VAAALHVSQRTLQASFRAERDMSPVEAIQRLRLWSPPP
jgi:transcriptional regulator GlxA family with amidase domain